MINKSKAQQEIDEATALFENNGGKVETVKTKSPVIASGRERLAELKKQRSELAKEEKALRDEQNANKAERKAARSNVNTAKDNFEEKRKELGNAMKVINGIHLTKSVQKHFQEFNEASGKLILAMGNMETANKEYLKAVREYKEF